VVIIVIVTILGVGTTVKTLEETFMRDLLEFVGLTEAARALGKTPETVRKYADAGRIRCVRDSTGRRMLIRTDLERLIREKTEAMREVVDNGKVP